MLILFILILLAGCREKDKPKDLLEEPLYMELLAEVFLVESYVEIMDQREKEDSLLNVVFEEYSVDRGRFERSHEFYQRQPDRQEARADSIRRMLQAERDTVMQIRQRLREEQERSEQEEAQNR